MVDAQQMCEALASGADFYHVDVETLERSEAGCWQAGEVTADKMVLATGAFVPVLKEPYLNLRAVWGHRVDITTSTTVPCIIHHKVSIAPTDALGNSAIGATHNVHYHPQLTDEAYDMSAGREELLAKANDTIALENVTVTADYVGLRSGSNDYFPIVGPVIHAKKCLEQHPELTTGKDVKMPMSSYHEGLYMINGVGGYGFVLAPYLAEQLASLITGGGQLDEGLQPSRFFSRWVRKQRL
jgi:tRNA 5-methylaminomethyl-2-thiouridine biosynthesis bifunctional protein